jgi:hypothetical protein
MENNNEIPFEEIKKLAKKWRDNQLFGYSRNGGLTNLELANLHEWVNSKFEKSNETISSIRIGISPILESFGSREPAVRLVASALGFIENQFNYDYHIEALCKDARNSENSYE